MVTHRQWHHQDQQRLHASFCGLSHFGGGVELPRALEWLRIGGITSLGWFWGHVEACWSHSGWLTVCEAILQMISLKKNMRRRPEHRTLIQHETTVDRAARNELQVLYHATISPCKSACPSSQFARVGNKTGATISGTVCDQFVPDLTAQWKKCW